MALTARPLNGGRRYTVISTTHRRCPLCSIAARQAAGALRSLFDQPSTARAELSAALNVHRGRHAATVGP